MNSKLNFAGPVLLGALAGAGVFLISTISEVVSHLYTSRIVLLLAGNFFFAGVAAFIVFRYEKHRMHYLRERLAVITEMNHHVRNALQVISYSAQAQQDEKLANMLRDAGHRIDWILREILGRDQF